MRAASRTRRGSPERVDDEAREEDEAGVPVRPEEPQCDMAVTAVDAPDLPCQVKGEGAKPRKSDRPRFGLPVGETDQNYGQAVADPDSEPDPLAEEPGRGLDPGDFVVSMSCKA